MVQALAFAELFLGGILVVAAYKGATVSEVVKGEAGQGVAPKPLAKSQSAAPAPASKVTSSAPGAQAPTADPGFKAASGTNYKAGNEPIIAQRLGKLATHLKVTLTGISGYRTPAHSVSVGGFPDDPHTKGEASDTEGTQNLSKRLLNAFGLERPFPQASEKDHIQLLHSATSFGGY